MTDRPYRGTGRRPRIEGGSFQDGVDLFHRGFWWEAHEVWEGLWRRAAGDEAELLQGLIQIAAACYHRAVGKPAGSQLEKGLARLDRLTGPVLGVDGKSLVQRLRDGKNPVIEVRL